MERTLSLNFISYSKLLLDPAISQVFPSEMDQQESSDGTVSQKSSPAEDSDIEEVISSIILSKFREVSFISLTCVSMIGRSDF